MIMHMRFLPHNLSVGTGLVWFKSPRVQLSECDAFYFNLIGLAKRGCFSVGGGSPASVCGDPCTSPACITTVGAEGDMKESNHSFHFTFKAPTASLIVETAGAGRWQIIPLKDILTRLSAADGLMESCLWREMFATRVKRKKKITSWCRAPKFDLPTVIFCHYVIVFSVRSWCYDDGQSKRTYPAAAACESTPARFHSFCFPLSLFLLQALWLKAATAVLWYAASCYHTQ